MTSLQIIFLLTYGTNRSQLAILVFSSLKIRTLEKCVAWELPFGLSAHS